MTSLPSGRDDAWRQMRALRRRAVETNSVQSVLKIFEAKYGIGLDEIQELYGANFWKDSQYGGNRWASICHKICKLIEVLKQQDHANGSMLITEILEMQHNTGVVKDKLSSLNSLET